MYLVGRIRQFGQVRDIIILESSWLGYYEPHSKRTINSLIGETLIKEGQIENVEKYGLQSFEMNVLEPTRTICEKIMSLVRFSYTETPIVNLKNKIRHAYDIHQLLQQEEFKTFIESEEFEEMLLKVANDDVSSFKNNNHWLAHHPNDSLFFKSLDEIWESELKDIYLNEFKNLVYGELPEENKVLESLKKLKEIMSKIDWKINLE
jgi:hypothetical protein